MTTNEAPLPTTYRCTTCWKEGLPKSLICDRLRINQWAEGTCLRCCNHNHG